MEITAHAYERYAERIMKKEDKRDINVFIAQNEAKIKTDIEKMIQYGTLLYSGKTNCGQKSSSPMARYEHSPVNVYQNDLWILLEDAINHKVITLYKIDLGLDEDFNKIFLDKMLERLQKAKEEKEEVQNSVNIECVTYKQLIKENEDHINQYKGYIKNLETLNADYNKVVEDLHVKNAVADQNIRDIISKLIGKKVF